MFPTSPNLTQCLKINFSSRILFLIISHFIKLLISLLTMRSWKFYMWMRTHVGWLSDPHLSLASNKHKLTIERLFMSPNNKTFHFSIFIPIKDNPIQWMAPDLCQNAASNHACYNSTPAMGKFFCWCHFKHLTIKGKLFRISFISYWIKHKNKNHIKYGESPICWHLILTMERKKIFGGFRPST